MTVPKTEHGPGAFGFDGNVLVSQIQFAVAETFGISPLEMVSARRMQPIASVRQIAMLLARELTPYSLPNIGRFFGNRDHTTIMHGIKAAQTRISGDEETAAKVDVIRRQFAAGNLERRSQILSHIDDPSARKIIIMHWWERGSITPEQAEQLIRDGELEAA